MKLAKTRRVSVSSVGRQGNAYSTDASISADGRSVAFSSYASNLVPGDSNEVSDVFVRDRKLQTTRRVSVGSRGAQGNGDSYGNGISPDGRFVVFSSLASSLVADDKNGVQDVFVRDRWQHKTTRVSLGTSSQEGNEKSFDASIAGDGRFVLFFSYASNLTKNDTNGFFDGFVRDLKNNTTTRISISTAGLQGDADSFNVFLGDFGLDVGSSSITADGRFVVFSSDASNIVADDTNNTHDVFLRDRWLHTTTRVSVTSAGVQGDGWIASISPDGKFVAFQSDAIDTNSATDVFVRGPLR